MAYQKALFQDEQARNYGDPEAMQQAAKSLATAKMNLEKEKEEGAAALKAKKDAARLLDQAH